MRLPGFARRRRRERQPEPGQGPAGEPGRADGHDRYDGNDQDDRAAEDDRDELALAAPRPSAADADWLWVLEHPCHDCGFDQSALVTARVPAFLRSNAQEWVAVLAGPEPARRPDREQQFWSPVEYACHVRDVHRVFTLRLTAMLTTDRPVFASWDQEVAAAKGRYREQDPTDVSAALVEAAAAAAELIGGITGLQWWRGGNRGDGVRFTVTSLTGYYVHELTHHLEDARRPPDPDLDVDPDPEDGTAGGGTASTGAADPSSDPPVGPAPVPSA